MDLRNLTKSALKKLSFACAMVAGFIAGMPEAFLDLVRELVLRTSMYLTLIA